MQSLSYFVLAAQLLTFAYSQAPVDPKAPVPGPGPVDPKAPPPPPASFLIFDPELTTLEDDSTDGAFVAASLSQPPKGPVSIYIEAPNLIFSRCKVTFTTKNWNSQQVFKISPMPYLTEAPANRQIKAKFCYSGKGDTTLHKSCQEYQVTRGKGNGGTCGSSGAGISFYTLAAQKYDFKGSGTFYLLKSGPITIQQLDTPFPGTQATVQSKIALRYYKTVYIFEIETRKARLVSQTGDGVDLTEAPGVSTRAVLSDGTAITVVYHGVPPQVHIAFAVVIGRNYKGRLSGLCGDFGATALVMANGLPAPDPNQFGNSWKVPDDDDLFSLGIRASSVVKSSNNRKVTKSECKMPDLDNIKEETKKKVSRKVRTKVRRKVVKKRKAKAESSGTFESQDNKNKLAKIMAEPKAADPKAPTEAWVSAATAQCTALLTISDVNAVLAPTKYIKDCVDNCILSKSYVFLESTKRDYLLAAREYIKSTKAEPAYAGNTPAAQNLNDVVIKACSAAGLGSDTECPSNCNGKGRCTYMGCACKDGYTGIDCSRKIPDSPPEDRSYTDEPAKPSLDVVQTPKAVINDEVKKAYQEEAAKKKNKKLHKKNDE